MIHNEKTQCTVKWVVVCQCMLITKEKFKV